MPLPIFGEAFFLKNFILIIFVLSTSLSSAQMFDSISASFKTKPKFMVKIGARNALITNSFMKIRDVGVGLNFKNTTKIGVVYSWMATDVVRPLSVPGVVVKNGEGELKMRYISPFFEYTFYKSKRYTLSIPLQAGFGHGFYKYKNDNGDKLATEQVAVAFYEPALVGEYFFLKFFSIGAGIGYRIMFLGNKSFEDRFTSPVYILKVKVHFGKILKAL